MTGWHGVDLDGTLAYQQSEEKTYDIGRPLGPMVQRVKNWLSNGEGVKILTARVAEDPDGRSERSIQDWCKKHIGTALPVTNAKDRFMIDLWDDKAVQVVHNVGEPAHLRVGPIRRRK